MTKGSQATLPDSADGSARPIRVAVVEDDAKLRQTLKLFISRTRELCYVGGYESAEAALKGLPGDRPDIVLMDIRLPGMSGVECVGHLRNLLPKTRAVMLTAYEDAEDVFQSLTAGAYGYLLKRAEPTRLREAIREAHQGGSPISGSVARKIVDFFRGAAPAGAPSAGRQSPLSPREVEILRRLSEGHTYKQIADELGSSLNTVCTHIKRIYEKFHAHSRTEAVRQFRSRGGR